MSQHDRRRSKSPDRHDHKRRRRTPPSTEPRVLPLGARELSRHHDLDGYRPLFALYLDIQKRIDINELDDHEAKGRWKSFVNKWNHGDLAEGWYEPTTFDKALKSATAPPPQQPQSSNSADESEDDFGPAPPPSRAQVSQPRAAPTPPTGPGPSIPTSSDLLAHREQSAEEAAAARHTEHLTLSHARKADRSLQSTHLEEIAPSSAPGTRDRLLEKKREANFSNSAFAASKTEGGDVELPDSAVMGSDSVGELKQMKADRERKRSERELRREETLRARRAEREEKQRWLREREERTMVGLKELAKARFG